MLLDSDLLFLSQAAVVDFWTESFQPPFTPSVKNSCVTLQLALQALCISSFASAD